MDLEKILDSIRENKTDQVLFNLIKELYPICRSITGNGVRESLNILKKHITVDTLEVPTGTKVFDWTIPKEWNIRDAYIKNKSGKKVVDFKKSNLHILNYSTPVDAIIPFSELKKHIYTLPEFPDWIPYKTSYYNENWGFCMAHNEYLKLAEENYHVYIDSSLENGSLTYGEYYLPGKVKDEILLSSHICHPSLCNDNLSGISVLTFLAKVLSEFDLKYSYRFLFIPGTIGAITWLAKNENKISNIKYGLVTACIGDSGSFTYKKSRQDNTLIDKIVCHVLKSKGEDFKIHEFSPYGYDERQFCSPGFNLPVGNLSRSMWGTFDEYHTSADNLTFIDEQKLLKSLGLFLEIIHVIETNECYINTNPKCEPQLGKRGLYAQLGGGKDAKEKEMAMLWVLNYSDGKHTLLDISIISNINYITILKTANILKNHNLLKSIDY